LLDVSLLRSVVQLDGESSASSVVLRSWWRCRNRCSCWSSHLGTEDDAVPAHRSAAQRAAQKRIAEIGRRRRSAERASEQRAQRQPAAERAQPSKRRALRARYRSKGKSSKLQRSPIRTSCAATAGGRRG
jgi:hypothetical protein